MELSLFTVTISIMLTTIGTVSTLTWWLSQQFNVIRLLIYTKMDETKNTLFEKLKYHERHDDERFQNIHNDLWDIRIRNAAKDGLTMPERTNVQN